mgnify:CR=1 FL=1
MTTVLSPRAAAIRRQIAYAAHKSKASHVGSALSVVEILEALYFRVANISKDNVNSPDRDRIILSKGHGSLGLYCTLAEKGIISRECLSKYLTDGGVLPCHIDMNACDGLEASTGSLGHGVGIAEGFALANRLKGIKARIFVIVGDGEFQEGSVFEALNSIGSLNLKEITVILDNNKFQASAATNEVVNVDNYEKIFEALNFNAIRVDGHDVDAIEIALKTQSDKPLAVIADTIKGKDFSIFENTLASHYIKLDDEKYAKTLADLGGLKQ